MMRLFSLQNFSLRLKVLQWFGRRPRDTATTTTTTATGAMANDAIQLPLYHPECLRRKQVNLSHLAQAPNNTLYELLHLVGANHVASAEIAKIDSEIFLAFLEAFYKDMTAAQISPEATPTTPQKEALQTLLALRDERALVDGQLKGNVNAFQDAWQKMRLSESDIAPLPEQADSHAKE